MGSGRSPADAGVLAGRRPVLELLRAGKPAQKVLIAQRVARTSIVGEIERAAAQGGVPVTAVTDDEIERVAPGLNHQGVVALTAKFRYSALDEILRADSPAVLFVDGVMDPHNLGSLVRSADGAGFNGLVIRVHRAAPVTATVRRVSSGATETVPIARVNNLARALDAGRQSGLWIVGLDPDAGDDLWNSHLFDGPIGLVVGSEEKGISKGVRDHCDDFVRIPLQGTLDSLNVAGAGAVAMFEVARRRHRSATL